MKRVQSLILAVIMFLGIMGTHSPVFGTEATPKSLKGKTREEVVELVGPLFTEEQKRCGILASVSMAQFLLETGFGQSELFRKASNGFGMNSVVSQNNWEGSTWDGKSVYRKNDRHLINGRLVSVPCKFRKYHSFEESIEDHSAYLIGAKRSDGSLRYKGIDSEKDYRKAAKIITDGGYSLSIYGDSLIAIIEKYDLTRFDLQDYAEHSKGSKSKAGVGIYTILSEDLNVRSSASPKAQILGKYLRGEQVEVLAVSSNNWGKVKTRDGKLGWMNLGYCAAGTGGNEENFRQAIAFQVTSDTLNIRSKANAKSSIYGFYRRGDTVEVIKMDGKWGLVSYKGKMGWINTGYCIRR